jgi:ketosteroid isomerase-like protein
MAERDFAAVLTAIKYSPAAPAAHQEVLHVVVSAIAANDMKALESYFTEDIELHIHGFAPLDGSWSGRDSVIAAATSNYQKLAEQSPQIETMIEQGDNVVWLLLESGHLKENGQRYEARGVIWWTFQGTRICRVEEFLHSRMPDKNTQTEINEKLVGCPGHRVT